MQTAKLLIVIYELLTQAFVLMNEMTMTMFNGMWSELGQIWYR